MKPFKKYIKENSDQNKHGVILGTVTLSNLYLSNIPNIFNNITIDGCFYIKNNKLKSLENFPKRVMGSINISENNLESLNGICEAIYNPLIANHNKLKNLKGFPRLMRDSTYINLDHNELTTLDGFSTQASYINPGDFSVEYNNLKSLEGGPKVVNDSLYIVGNPIETLDGFPEIITNDIYASRSFKFKEYQLLDVCRFRKLILIDD